MIHLPNMLLIGSADRNIGKTELACSVLRHFTPQGRLAGLKVTAIRERGGACPRGGEGCGVCAALEGEYLLTEESQGDPAKDTGRLKAAGARPVYWLRALVESLEPAMEAALGELDPRLPVICESNSLRRVVEPGLFLMVERAGTGPQGNEHPGAATTKESAAAVWHWADRVVTVRPGAGASGQGEASICGLDLADLSLAGRRGATPAWALREDAGAIVMAGGQSRRMGRDKARLPVHGRPLIEHVCDQLRPRFRQILISAARDDGYGIPGASVVVDPVAGQGPLHGMAAALRASQHDTNLVIACDIPQVDAGLLRHMLRLAPGRDCVVPRTAAGHSEPLFAIYRRSALEGIDAVLRSGSRRVRDVHDRCDTCYVDLAPGREPTNLNTPDEYRRYLDRATHSGTPESAVAPPPG